MRDEETGLLFQAAPRLLDGAGPGVGFRYRAESAALELKLVGWVRNLPDGRVEAVTEGKEAALNGFLDRVAGGPMKGYIRRTETFLEESTGEFDDFRIRFY